MLVSVIMPTYNCGKFILQSLDSVIAQTVTDWEVQIVDDCSTDNTAEVLKPYLEKYPNIHYYGSVNIDSLRSSYAISKQAAELLCKAYSSEYGVDTVIARPGHVYGPTASPTDKRVSTDFAFKAANQCSLVLKSSGLQRRSYCYCVDVAAALLTILINGNRAESYNVGTRDVLTIKEMASIYAQAGNVSLEYVLPTEEELGAFNPMDNSSLNCDKLYSLGFQSSFSAREGMEHTVKILRECQVKGSK